MNRFNYIFDKMISVNNISFYVCYLFICTFLTLYFSPLYFETSFSIIIANWCALSILSIIIIQIFIFSVKYTQYKNRLRRAERAEIRNNIFRHSYRSNTLNSIVKPDGSVELISNSPTSSGLIDYNKHVNRQVVTAIVPNSRIKYRTRQSTSNTEERVNNILRKYRQDRARRDQLKRDQIEHILNRYRNNHHTNKNDSMYDLFFKREYFKQKDDPIINSVDDFYDE